MMNLSNIDYEISNVNDLRWLWDGVCRYGDKSIFVYTCV